MLMPTGHAVNTFPDFGEVVKSFPGFLSLVLYTTVLAVIGYHVGGLVYENMPERMRTGDARKKHYHVIFCMLLLIAGPFLAWKFPFNVILDSEISQVFFIGIALFAGLIFHNILRIAMHDKNKIVCWAFSVIIGFGVYFGLTTMAVKGTENAFGMLLAFILVPLVIIYFLVYLGKGFTEGFTREQFGEAAREISGLKGVVTSGSINNLRNATNAVANLCQNILTKIRNL